MKWQDKFIPGFLLLQVLMSAMTLLRNGMVTGLSIGMWTVVLPFTLVALVAGIAAFKQLRWARMLIVAIYAAQVVSYVSPSFVFDLWLGLHFNLSFGWIGGGKIGLNLLALGMMGWAGSRWFPYDQAHAPRA